MFQSCKTAFAPLTLLLALLPFVVSAQAAEGDDYDHAGLARQALEAHIRPGYGRLAAATGDLAEHVDTLCKAPSPEALGSVREAFRQMVLAWSAVEHLRFGPIAQQNRYERIAFWPDLKGIGRRQVFRTIRKRDESVLDPQLLAEKSVALQGLTALEPLLYGKYAGRLASGSEDGEFRCGYALAIARNLSSIAGEVRAAWAPDGDFAEVWLSPGSQNPVYRKPSEVTLELVKAYNYGLELVREAKLVGPLGMHSPGGKPSRPQYAASGLAIPSIVANIKGVKHLYTAGGLEERLQGPYPGMAKLINLELDAVLRLAEALPVDDAKAFSDPDAQDKLIAMGFPLKNARETGGGALGQVAGLTIGFNAGDGD